MPASRFRIHFKQALCHTENPVILYITDGNFFRGFCNLTGHGRPGIGSVRQIHGGNSGHGAQCCHSTPMEKFRTSFMLRSS